jgi:choline dehydrogenase-like flavoprotein
MTLQLTDSQRTVLRALADTVVPSLRRDEDATGFWVSSGSDLGADAGVAATLAQLPQEQLAGLLGLLDGLHVLGFSTGSQRSREQLLRNVALMGAAPAAGMNALTSLTLAIAYCAPNPATGLNPMWQTWGYGGPPTCAPCGAQPLPTVVPKDGETVLDADVCVVGSGAGGGVIAGVLAQAGLDVVVLEAGGNRNETDFNGLELAALQNMFWRGGPTPTADFNVSVLAGATLGGGPTINWSNCLRTPAWIRDQWAGEFGLHDVARPEFDRHLDAVWTRFGVNDRCSDLNGPHQRMRDGAAALGWSFTTLSRNADPAVYSPDSAGHIGFGDRSGAKLDIRRTYLCDAVEAGARILANCTAQRVLSEGGRAAGVQAVYTHPQTGATSSVTVHAPRVVVACGSLESPALLLRSGIGGPAVGRYLRLHPVLGFLGLYPDKQTPWWGAPMTAMVDEFANIEDGYGFLIQNAQWALSIITAGMARASGAEHKQTMARLEHAAFLIGISRDRGHGTVTIDKQGNGVVRYALTDELDVRIARTSIEKQIRLQAAAGADEIVPFTPVPARWRRGENLEKFIAAMQHLPLRVGGHKIFSAHQMSSCRMGTDPATSVANPSGELHETPGVYIGDASAMPTASGVNPMITAMALAHRTAESIAATATAARPAVHA